MKRGDKPLQRPSAVHDCRQIATMLQSVGFQLELCGPEQGSEPICGVVVDSRELEPGLLFAARRGLQRDGHDYIATAWQQGCRNFMVARDWWQASEGKNKALRANFLIVDGDVEQALLAWAQAYRQSLKQLMVIAISGSYGKTSSKELLSHMLAQRYRCCATAGNRNALVGCAMTILGLPQDSELAVLELGIDQPGEMDLLCAMAQPNIALLTGIGTAHMQAFSSQEELAREKARIYRGLSANPSFSKCPLVFLPASDKYLRILREAVPPDCDICLYPIVKDPPKDLSKDLSKGSAQDLAKDLAKDLVEDLGLEGLRIRYGGQDLNLPLLGLHMQQIFWGASTVAEALGLSSAEIVAGAQAYQPLFGRGELQHRQLRNLKLTLLQDCYNASPESVYALLRMLGAWRERGLLPPTVLVLADMLELGISSIESHRRVGELLLDFSARPASSLSVLFYGEEMKTAQLAIDVGEQCSKEKTFDHWYFNDATALGAKIDSELQRIATEKPLEKCVEKCLEKRLEKPLLVLKGARAMHLEKIAEKILR